jgi:hypothetical protein
VPYNVPCRLDHYHAPIFDDRGRLLPWLQDEHGPFHSLLGRLTDWWLSVPRAGQWPLWCTAAKLRRNFEQVGGAVPASACAMAINAFLRYYEYTGEERHREVARTAGEYLVRQALTPASFGWPKFPWPAGATGDPNPDGSGHPFCAEGQIMPDKGGMVGHALLALHESVGDPRYLQAAADIADVLVLNARPPSQARSPWPFRVDARTGEPLDGPLCANHSHTIALFDELLRLGAARDAQRTLRVRDELWQWLLEVPLADPTGALWLHFFEDHSGDEQNATAFSALELAKLLLRRRQALAPDWLGLVSRIAETVEQRWAVHRGSYLAIGEQDRDMSPYNSHTARLGAVYAALAEQQGTRELKARALSSLAYATYSVDEDGFADTYYLHDIAWTTDSFGDLLIHFLEAMAAVPEWAPRAESHILRSSSILTSVRHQPLGLEYQAFDDVGSERIRLAFAPSEVKFEAEDGGTFAWDAGTQVLEVERRGCRLVRVLGRVPSTP